MTTSCNLVALHLPQQEDFYEEKLLKLMSDILGVSLKYRRFLSATAPSSQHLVMPLKKIACTIAEAQSGLIRHMRILLDQPSNALRRSPERWQLLHSPAFIETSILALAGWCKFMQAWSNSSRAISSSNSNKGGRSSSSKKKGSSSSNSSSSKKKGSSSSSSTTAATAASPPSTFLQLVVPDDHCSFGDGLAQEYASDDAWDELQGPVLMLLEGMKESGDPSSGQAWPFGNIMTSSHLQLLLETVALAGAYGAQQSGEVFGDLVGGMLGCVEFLPVVWVGIAAAAVEQRMAFVAARGGLLLQVCRLVLEACHALQQPQQHQPQWPDQQMVLQQAVDGGRLQVAAHAGKRCVHYIFLYCTLDKGMGMSGKWHFYYS